MVTAAEPVSISSIAFEEPNIKTGDEQSLKTATDGNDRTYDGNQVDVIVSLANSGATAASTTVTFGDPASGSSTGGPTEDVSVPGDGSATVDEVLDTSGLAWEDEDGVMQGDADGRTIAATLSNGNTQSRTLDVWPKPVVLVHGWNSDARTWAKYTGTPGTTGFFESVNPDWKSYPVGDTAFPGVGTMKTAAFNTNKTDIDKNAAVMRDYIDALRNQTNAAHIDVVAHSMGGMIARDYIGQNMPSAPQVPNDTAPVIDHLVMLGTPNGGSNCAIPIVDVQRLLGINNVPTYELTPEFLGQFNAKVHDERNVAFSELAGNFYHPTPGHAYCTGPALPDGRGDNDGVVSVASAFDPSVTFAPGDSTETARLVHGCGNILFSNEKACFLGSPLAFTFVAGQLALDPADVNDGGEWLGPLDSADDAADARHRTVASEADAHAAKAQARTRAHHAQRASRPLCFRRVIAPEVENGARLSVEPGASRSATFSVPAHAGVLQLTVVADPSVSLSLVAPNGRVAQTGTSGSLSADLPIRHLEAADPVAGTWKLVAQNESRTAAASVLTAETWQHNAITVTATGHKVSRHLDEYRLQVTVRPAAAVRVTLSLTTMSGTSTKRLRSHSAQRDQFLTTIRSPTDGSFGLIMVRARNGAAEAWFDLNQCAPEHREL